MKQFIFALLLAPLMIWTACTPAEQQPGELETDTVQAQVSQEIDDFRMNVEARLSDVDESLDSLEAEAEMAGEEAQSEVGNAVAELREERDSLQRDLEQIGDLTQESFQDIRADVEQRLDQLEENVDSALAELQNESGNAPSS